MTHNEERTHWLKEGAIGLGVGVLYGVTNTSVGHPFDTIKTKMQAQVGFETGGMVRTLMKTLRTQGVIGLYRGCIPPLMGSGIYRSTQFAVFEASYTYLDNFRAEIPGTFGLQARVVIAGMIASTSRAIIECPLEYVKINRQIGQSWYLKHVYTGFGVTWIRTMGLMTSYFIFIDTGRRHFSKEFSSPILGPFLASGIAATLGWWIVWPFECLKSQVQGGYGKDRPLLVRMAQMIKERGFFSLYRGLGPGSIRSFLANGVSMIVMSNAQKMVSKYGLRD